MFDFTSMKLLRFLCFSLFIACLATACNSSSDKNTATQTAADSLKPGEKSEFYKNGKLHYIVEYKNGKANGRVKEYTSTGYKYMDATYKDGLRNGICTLFLTNGKPYSIVNYVNEAKEGVETIYNPDGKQEAVLTYKNNKVQPGLKEFMKDGTPVEDNTRLMVTEVDQTKRGGKYFIRLSLTPPHSDAIFYAAPQSDPDSREKLQSEGNWAILVVPLAEKGFILKKLVLDAEYKTALGNTRRLQRLYSLAIGR